MTPEAPVRTDSFRPVLGATVLLVLALLAIAALKSSRDLEAAHGRERLLETRIAATRAESERLRLRVDRLRNDPGMLERLAREDLGMVRPGDVVIELPDPRAPAPPARVAPPAVPVPVPASSSPAAAVAPMGPPLSPEAGSAGPPAPPASKSPAAAPPAQE
ncbi:MAG TPA: septum formation initiator family protein [Thermoanaerobaculia bacterium]|nr:septum formation initiator family protein [Thermoanaerobaculia bacterium]